jgi:ABC-type Mn2+/Zn2+ transport system permease subunit
VSPSIIASGVLGVVILHTGFGVPWRRAYVPAIIFMVIYMVLCVGMFWARKQFDRSRDLRLGVSLFGMFGLVTGLVGMWYAGDRGIVSSATFADNRIPFSVFMLICTTISVALVSWWKPNSKPK